MGTRKSAGSGYTMKTGLSKSDVTVRKRRYEMEILRRWSFSKKIVGLTAVTILALSATIFATTYVFIYRSLSDQARKEALANAAIIESQVEYLKGRLAMAASLMAVNPEVATAVKEKKSDYLQQFSKSVMKNLDGMFITIADKDGNVVARGHSDKTGDNVLSQINIQKALAGETSSGIEEGTVVKFSLRAGYPVKVDGQIVGSITTGIDLSSNNSFVDEMKKKLGVECTLFHMDTRVITTIVKDGQRAVGTRMDNPQVIETVLKKGEKFHGVNTIMGREYDTIYWPVVGANGKIIGMYFAGHDRVDFTRTFKTILMSIYIPIGVAGAFMLMIAFFIARSMTNPIKLSIDFAKGISSGDLTRTLDIRQKDEVGELAGALNQMASDLRQMIRKIADTLQTLTSSSTGLSDIAEQMNTGAADQSGRAHQVATASEQMSQTVVDAARNASAIADSVTETTRIAKEGEEIVTRSVEEVQQIATTVGESAVLLKSLGDRSKQISAIINVIDDIADQTNLLALNAAIEAARAGEQGRGFAVVADEVRKLAERTAKSTSEIAHMIKNIQDEVDHAILTMEDATGKVDIGAQLTSLAGSAFSSIAGRVDDLNSKVQQIASATEEMASTSEEISRDIESIAQVSRDTSMHSEQTSRASVQLVDLSRDLGNIVSGFKV
jgi:methyl-accepting chemotaxis protein